jgi:uncharacterized membrane protein
MVMPRSHPRWIRRLFSDADLEAIVRAIREVEAASSGEVRVHMERHVEPARGAGAAAADPLVRARAVFQQLGMHRTARRNGVLIYLAVEDRRLAIVGDEGIHARVGESAWTGIRDLMVGELRAGHPTEALLGAIAEVARLLARHYPPSGDDTDELPDRISTS